MSAFFNTFQHLALLPVVKLLPLSDKFLPAAKLVLILPSPGQKVTFLVKHFQLSRALAPSILGAPHNLCTALLSRVMDFFVICHAS